MEESSLATPPPAIEESSPLALIATISVCIGFPVLLLLQQRGLLPWKQLGAEALGSALFKAFVFTAGLTATHNEWEPSYAIVFTLATVWLCIVCIAFPLGAHCNSAVTVGVMASGQLSPVHALLYMLAQHAGCALAVEGLRFAIPPSLLHAISPMKPPGSSSLLGACGIEMLFTGLNVLLALGNSIFSSHKAKATASLVLVLILTAKLVTEGGASLDPTGAFAEAYFARDFEYLKLYWTCSLIGATISGLVYRELFLSTGGRGRAAGSNVKRAHRDSSANAFMRIVGIWHVFVAQE
ncbi:MAG: hypothetical protein SGPRY_009170 [Prymnesium sp.]